MDEAQRLNDQLKQSAHAAKIRQERYDREHPKEKAASDLINKVGAAVFNRIMNFAKDAQPAFVGQESRAEQNSFDKPSNAPKVLVEPTPVRTEPTASRSGVEGGSITFVVCKDNGDGSFTQGKVTADATFVADA